MQILRNPTVKTSQKIIKKAIREKKNLILIGKCLVGYEGRANSILANGERIVIIKPDGTMLVHQESKREPVNWNPPGCKATTSLEGEGLRLISKRNKPQEKLSILFKAFKLVASFDLIDDEELEIVGTEEDLVDSVIKNPGLIEEGFRPKEREKTTDTGLIDLFGFDSSGRGIVLEFKRGKATISAVGQLNRYTKCIEKELDKEVRGILVAPSLTSGARKLLKNRRLEFVKIDQLPTHKISDVSYDKDQRRIGEF